jgi:hypothetical protein
MSQEIDFNALQEQLISSASEAAAPPSAPAWKRNYIQGSVAC